MDKYDSDEIDRAVRKAVMKKGPFYARSLQSDDLGKGKSMDARSLQSDVGQAVPMPEVNTYRQYLMEKEAGDPNALNLSFQEWKKL